STVACLGGSPPEVFRNHAIYVRRCTLHKPAQYVIKIFVEELRKQIPAVIGWFNSCARHLVSLHLASGFQRYLWRIKHCFVDDHLTMIEEGSNLFTYATMNTIVGHKILKKYEK
ncbi:hypothetical protein KI387_024953, partial [Taxus chinensis]